MTKVERDSHERSRSRLPLILDLEKVLETLLKLLFISFSIDQTESA